MSFNSINNALQAFSKISLEEMNGVKLMDRVESKFILSAKQLPEILNQIKNDYRVVSILGNLTPSYKTVYFDTDSFYFYHEHHRGRKNRYKVRFRNYVESNLTFLEVKHKQNGRIDKQRIKVNNNNFILSPEDLMFLKEANIDQTELKQKRIYKDVFRFKYKQISSTLAGKALDQDKRQLLLLELKLVHS